MGLGKTVAELQGTMSRKEFNGWKRKYNRDPWGIHVDDKRHAQVCVLLNSISTMFAKSARKVNTKPYFSSKLPEELKNLKKLLYTDTKAPWLEGLDQRELALEGQAIFNDISNKYGKKK